MAARANAPIAIEVFMLSLSLCHLSVAVFSSGSRTATAKHGETPLEVMYPLTPPLVHLFLERSAQRLRNVKMGNHGLGAAWAVCLREATSDRLFDPSLTANLYTDPKLLDVAGGAGRWRACRTCRSGRLAARGRRWP